jgi:serine/threonine-protein kinase
MAPEMLRFQAPVDARADIYALGCVAYWLLTGARVFEATTLHDMLVMHAHQKPIPPSKRLGAPVHEALEEVIMACLDKNPNRRPQTARELSEFLSSLSFQSPWDEEFAEVWWTRHESPRPSHRRATDPEELRDAAEPPIAAAPVSRTG